MATLTQETKMTMAADSKYCYGCKQTKSKTEFWRNSRRSDGLQTHCKPCKKKLVTTESNKYWNIRHRYNITEKEYKERLEYQDFRCAICGAHQDDLTKKLHVDYCHSLGFNRGLLCGNCNTAIGLFKENIDVMKKAIDYIMNEGTDYDA